MLTESERAWLKYRDIANPRGTYFCEYCKNYVECHSDMLWGIDECPTAPLSLLEAAEFEARVAALLAEIMPRALADPWFIENAKYINADVTQKLARLSVEEEMDAERK